MRKIYNLMAFVLLVVVASAQSVTLNFTGMDVNNKYVQLDSIHIRNLNYGWRVALLWPDTTLTLSVTGVENFEDQDFAYLRLSQNIPNPFESTTYVNLDVAQAGDVSVEITDITGRLVKAQQFRSAPGHYQLRVTLSSVGIYFLTARMNGQTATVKMVNRGNGGANNLELTDNMATWHVVLPQTKGAYREIKVLPFESGNEMEYVGFATFNDGLATESQTYLHRLPQNDSANISLIFNRFVTDGLSCQKAPTLTDIDCNVYNTVMIGNQCWMKENMRTTRYADSTLIPLDTAGDNKPCRYLPNNDSANLAQYGYLYNWYAVMHGEPASVANPSGVQGICPEAWHVPSDSEWTKLTDYMSHVSSYICDRSDSETVAKSLASKKGWELHSSFCAVGYDTASNDASGFNALPAGNFIGSHNLFGYDAYFWSTTQGIGELSILRELAYHKSTIKRDDNLRRFGFSVRCIRDKYSKPSVITYDTVSNITAFTAICGGEVVGRDEDSVMVTAYGLCWSNHPNPTIADSLTEHPNDNTDTIRFMDTIRGLTHGTTYYVRAYATNIAGTAYGNEVSFTTLMAPVVHTKSLYVIEDSSLVCVGEVTENGGLDVIRRGVCWGTTPHPVETGNHTNNSTGLGIFNDTISGLQPNTIYYFRTYAANSAGTGYGEERSFTIANICSGTPYLIDVDGNIYNTVQIGDQCWMRENLRTTRYADSTQIQMGDTANDMLPLYYLPANSVVNVPTCGDLYNWMAVMHGAESSEANPSGVQGVCPDGWHVPSAAEWTQLMGYVRSQSNYLCSGVNGSTAKALSSKEGWTNSEENCAPGNNPSSNNATYFGGYPVGYFVQDSYVLVGETANIWTATQTTSAETVGAHFGGLQYNSPEAFLGSNLKSCGEPVRCVRN